jgi:predicted RNA-binding Zn-ribbon protein involved in translation (DUF1610 family)
LVLESRKLGRPDAAPLTRCRLETAVTFQDVSTSEQDGDHDACPNCGTRVESAISAPGEPVREATQRRCPNCGKVLRREVGGTWTIDETAS